MIIPAELIKHGAKIRGVVHIGSNDGAEIGYYVALGIENIVCFDPLPKAAAAFLSAHCWDTRVLFIPAAFGDREEYRLMTVTSFHGQQSTFLPVINREVAYGEENYPESELLVHLTTFDRFMASIPPKVFERIHKCNCLVIDVQGMEYQVLRGMVQSFSQFDCAGVECSAEPIYEGERPESDIVELMRGHGFAALNQAGQHGDVLFMRQ